ncbi:MAG: UvrD-helicase domain-containing protein, partial [Casimicrobiaceae bacterium]
MLSLNAAQREAVRHDRGPLLVLAGAGSGKTRVIAAKIAHLIERGAKPSAIVAITFTNRAAREMRERAGELLARRGAAPVAKAVRISTFHALGLSILRGEHRA